MALINCTDDSYKSYKLHLQEVKNQEITSENLDEQRTRKPKGAMWEDSSWGLWQESRRYRDWKHAEAVVMQSSYLGQLFTENMDTCFLWIVAGCCRSTWLHSWLEGWLAGTWRSFFWFWGWSWGEVICCFYPLTQAANRHLVPANRARPMNPQPLLKIKIKKRNQRQLKSSKRLWL